MSLLGELTAAGARDYLQSLRRHAASEQTRYEQIRDSHDWSGGDDFFRRAALENGLLFTRTEIEWADWTLDALDRRVDR